MKTATTTGANFFTETIHYAQQIRLFTREDWLAYIAWVGLMLGLLFSVSGFVAAGYLGGAQYPSYVWNIPLGILIFVGAIAFDTIGHRTAYKEELAKGEALVHHITIAAGVSSIIMLCLGYSYPQFCRAPALVLIALSVLYSVIDEALHWHRYLRLKSDRVEMWSHFFIFVGHNIMVVSWWQWFSDGYPGVSKTLQALGWGRL